MAKTDPHEAVLLGESNAVADMQKWWHDMKNVKKELLKVWQVLGLCLLKLVVEDFMMMKGICIHNGK